MSINLHLPTKEETLRPTITVVGVGGAGGNAVNNMITAKLEGVNFIVANTDAQALENSICSRKIQLGGGITRGLGAGASPDVGKAAAEEAMDDLGDAIAGSNMVFITAGMGGGTGTGAAPVVARMAREQGILTVGVVTKPFHFEGTHRMKLAESGLSELQNYVDTLIVIPNQNLFRIATERTTFADAFKMADEVLHSGVRGVTDLIVKPGLVNLDFADIRTVMREMGKAMMGTGEATGERRALDAAEAAISNPLLDDVSLKGARAVLINITGGMDMTLFEVDEAANRIRAEVDPDANIIFGSTFNEIMDGRMRVSVVATGIDAASGRVVTSASAGITAPKPYVIQPAAPRSPQPAAQTVASPSMHPNIIPMPQHAAPQHQPFAAQPARPSADSSTPRPMSPTGSASANQRGFEFAAQEAYGAQTYHEQDMLETRVLPKASERVEPQLFSSEPPREAQRRDPAPTYVPPAAALKTVKREEPSFFQKVAGIGKAMTARPEQPQRTERTVQVAEKSVPSSVANAPAKHSEDDYLDIPAFLRRQANN